LRAGVENGAKFTPVDEYFTRRSFVEHWAQSPLTPAEFVGVERHTTLLGWRGPREISTC